MDRVYDKNGGYTPEAVDIDNQVRNEMKSLIRYELEKGTPIEALEHVICNSVRKEILKQSLGIRLGKDIDGN